MQVRSPKITEGYDMMVLEICYSPLALMLFKFTLVTSKLFIFLIKHIVIAADI